MLPAEGYAQLAISTMLDLKARDIVLMDIADVSLIAEYFVVCYRPERVPLQCLKG